MKIYKIEIIVLFTLALLFVSVVFLKHNRETEHEQLCQNAGGISIIVKSDRLVCIKSDSVIKV